MIIIFNWEKWELRKQNFLFNIKSASKWSSQDINGKSFTLAFEPLMIILKARYGYM